MSLLGNLGYKARRFFLGESGVISELNLNPQCCNAGVERLSGGTYFIESLDDIPVEVVFTNPFGQRVSREINNWEMYDGGYVEGGKFP